jgi:hypothetical protein
MGSTVDVARTARAWCAEHPCRALWLVLALVLAFHAPSLAIGLCFDDFPHQLVLEGWSAGDARPWSLYDFGSAPRPGDQAYELGIFPWWTSEDWSVRFFRPLTSLSIALDQRLYGHFELGYHLTSLALFVAVLALARGLYRALGLDRPTALLALLVFGLEDSSAIPVGWTANRNSLLELLFQLASALLVLRSHRPLAVATQAGALLLALLAALSKESGVSAFALVALATLWRARIDAPPAPRRRALLAASIAIACALAYVAALGGAGFGARSGFYPVPWSSTAELAAWTRRALLLLAASPAALCSPLTLDLCFLAPRIAWFYVPALIVASALLAAVLRASLARDPRVPFLCAWWLVALLPQAGAAPSDRLLFNSAFAASGLIAFALTGPAPAWTQPFRRLLATSVTVLSAAALVLVQSSVLTLGREARSAVLEAELPLLVDSPAGRDVLVLQAPNGLAALSPVATWVWHHPEEPPGATRFWVLQAGPRAVEWRVVDARTFELQSLDEPFAARPFESVYLAPGDRAEAGRVWRTALFTVEALAVEAGFARTVRVSCERELGDPGMAFLAWEDGRWRALAPPEPGGSLTLARARSAAPIAP